MHLSFIILNIIELILKKFLESISPWSLLNKQTRYQMHVAKVARKVFLWCLLVTDFTAHQVCGMRKRKNKQNITAMLLECSINDNYYSPPTNDIKLKVTKLVAPSYGHPMGKGICLSVQTLSRHKRLSVCGFKFYVYNVLSLMTPGKDRKSAGNFLQSVPLIAKMRSEPQHRRVAGTRATLYPLL